MKAGFSLIELLIYIAILSVILVSVASVFLVVSQIRARTNAQIVLNENARLILGKVRDSILDAGSATLSGVCPTNVLTLIQGSATTTYQITNQIFEVIEQGGPAQALSASSVMATSSASCLFAKIDNPPPAKSTVKINLRLRYNGPRNTITDISQDHELAVSLR